MSVAPSPFPEAGITEWASVWEHLLSVVSNGKVSLGSELISPPSCANRLPFPCVLLDMKIPSDKLMLMLPSSFTLLFDLCIWAH